MKFIKSKFISIFIFFYIINNSLAFAFDAPETFSNLAEKLSPSVVNISTTSIVKQRQQTAPSFDDFFNFPFNAPNKTVQKKEL